MTDSSADIRLQVIDAWKTAGDRLGIVIHAPYNLSSPAGEPSMECIAYLPDFGGPKGMVIGTVSPPRFRASATLASLAANMAFIARTSIRISFVHSMTRHSRQPLPIGAISARLHKGRRG